MNQFILLPEQSPVRGGFVFDQKGVAFREISNEGGTFNKRNRRMGDPLKSPFKKLKRRIRGRREGGRALPLLRRKIPHVPHPMLRFNNFKTENSGRNAKNILCPHRNARGGVKRSAGGKTPLPEKGMEGEGREGEGREGKGSNVFDTNPPNR